MASFAESSMAMASSNAAVTVCSFCSRSVAGGAQGWAGHIRGKSHKALLANPQQSATPRYDTQIPASYPMTASPNPSQTQMSHTCVPCDEAVPQELWEKHLNGWKHIRKAGSTLCIPCNRIILRRDWRSHVTSKGHLAVTTTSASISSPSGYSPPPPSSTDTIFCTDCDTSVLAIEWLIHEQSSTHQDNAAQVPSSGLYDAEAPTSDVEALEAPSAANENVSPRKSSQAKKMPKVTCDRVVLVTIRKGRRVLFPGVRASHVDVIRWKTKRATHPVPKDIRDIFRSQTPDFSMELDEVEKWAPSTSSTSTYGRSWTALTFVEEIQIRHGNTRYDIRGVPLIQRGPYYELCVPGLEEHYSVRVGDTVAAKNQDWTTKRAAFEGHIHYVDENGVGIRFHDQFQAQEDELFDIEFQLNCSTLQRMRDALVMSLKQIDRRRLLFPQLEHFAAVPSITNASTRDLRRDLVNNLILYNPQQLLAVSAIKARPFGSPPLIILGAPGTGKTTAAVEGIRQILLQYSNAHILVCTPSNTGADFIAQSLLDLGRDVLFRLNAPSRPIQSVPHELLPFTSVTRFGNIYPTDSMFGHDEDEDFEVFSCPAKDVLMQFKVVVSTCAQGGIPGGIGIPQGHFTHVFIDDAGQLLEPEVMIPIRTMSTAMTNIILFGDHKQMGPVVHSPIARQLGFGVSYLERLMDTPPYDDESARPGTSVVRLTWNLRTHPTILKFPSDAFYDGKLYSRGKPDIVNIGRSSKGLFERNFSIIFHAVQGENIQDAEVLSYSNDEEAAIVEEYATKLRSIGLPNSDVGIIAPYEAQCREVRSLLQISDGPGAGYKVGRVEDFQGQDRAAIVISTVRSDPSLVANYDRMYGLGFVGQPQRLNVAITRARALLIIVGDPTVLGLDPLWRTFMNYILVNGGWRGGVVDEDVLASNISLDDALDAYTNSQAVEYPAIADIPWRGNQE